MNKTSILMLASGIFLLDIAMKSLNDDINPNAQSGAGKIYIPRDDASRDWLDASVVSWEQIAEHYAPSEGIGDWQKLHSERHWKEGHSAYELASSWENTNPDLPPEIQSLFYGPVKLLSATPEHKTPLPGGRAASQSDVLAFIRINDRVCAVAVEGKVDESFGVTVGKWSENASSGKIKRLKHISKKLGLSYPPADEIRYQLLHRTASAVIEAQHFKADCAAMIVQSFSPENKWFEDYSAFLGLFGIQSAKQDKLYKTDKPGITLYFGWAGSQKQPVAAVSDTAVAKTTAPSTLTVTQTIEAPISSTETIVSTETAAVADEKAGSALDKSKATLFNMYFVWILLVVGVVVAFFAWKYTRKKSSVHEKTDQKVEGVAAEAGTSSKLTESMQELHSKLDKVVAETKQTKQMLETMDSKTKLKEIEDKIKEIEKIKDKTPDDENYKKGLEFEEFVVNTFDKNKNLFTLLNWSGDKITSTGIYPKDATDPDLKYDFSLFGKKYPFAVECKWRSGFSYGFSKDDQLKRYKAYEKRERRKTFIALGVGGKPNNPERVFIMPVNEINKVILSESELKRYEQHKKTRFYYDIKTNTLKLC